MEFNARVRQQEEPQDIETVPLPDDLRGDGAISVDKLLARLGLAESDQRRRVENEGGRRRDRRRESTLTPNIR